MGSDPDPSTKSAAPKTDPGLAPFGNFINYYQFNSAEARLQLLPGPDASTPNFWSQAATNSSPHEPYLVLDVGCNAGNFTQLLYTDFLRTHVGDDREIHVLGIDIDAGLIERAQQHNAHAQNVSYLCLDVLAPEAQLQVQAFLDKHSAGRGRRFNAIFCMSVTLWIHLNAGDEGLQRFLDLMDEWCELLVIEPQPWKCYGTAVRRQKRADGGGQPFELFAQLRWRADVEQQIDGHLRRGGRRKRIWQTVPTKWQRRIALYERSEAQTGEEGSGGD